MARMKTRASSLLLRMQSHGNHHALRREMEDGTVIVKLGGIFLYSYTCTHCFVFGSSFEVGSITLSRLIQMLARWMTSYRRQKETKSWLLIRMRHSRKESNHSASLKHLTVLSVNVGGYRVRVQRTLWHGLKCRYIKERNTRALLLFPPHSKGQQRTGWTWEIAEVNIKSVVILKDESELHRCKTTLGKPVKPHLKTNKRIDTSSYIPYVPEAPSRIVTYPKEMNIFTKPRWKCL